MPTNKMTGRALLVKREATPYTAVALLAANGIGDLADLGFVAIDPKRIDNKNQAKQQFGNTAAQNDAGAAVQSLAVTVPVRPAAAAGSVPLDIAELLAGLCGMTETITAATSVVYTPSTPADIDAAPTCSLGLYEAGKLHLFTGARGSFKLSAAVGKRALMSFDVKSPYAAPTANQAAPTVAASAGQALVFSGAVAVTEAGASVPIASIELDFGGNIVEHVSNQGVRILFSENAPKITINPISVVTAVEWDALLNSTSIAINCNFGAGGMILDIPSAQLVDMGSEDQDGRIGRSKTFECLGGDTAFSLAF